MKLSILDRLKLFFGREIFIHIDLNGKVGHSWEYSRVNILLFQIKCKFNFRIFLEKELPLLTDNIIVFNIDEEEFE